MQYALASFQIASNKQLSDQLKSLLHSTGFRLISFLNPFEGITPPQLHSFSLDDYARECAYKLKTSTDQGSQIVEHLPELDYLCLTSTELEQNMNNPFMVDYLFPVLADVAPDIKMLIWTDEGWLEEPLGVAVTY